MTSEFAGTTLRAVPDPAIEKRRAKIRKLQAEGLSHSQIADRLGFSRALVKEDLRPTPKESPTSIRFPHDVETRGKAAALRMGVSFGQFVVESVRQRIDHQDRNRERQRDIRGAEADQ